MSKNRTNRIINLYDVYVILFVLYQYANMYIQTSLSVLGAFVPMLFICFYYYYQALFKLRPQRYIKVLVIFITFLSIYGLIHWLIGEYVGGVKPNNFLFDNFVSLAPVLVFYYGTLKGEVTEKRMYLYLMVLVLVSIVSYFYYYTSQDLTLEGSVTKEGATNNISYYFVSMLPLVFLFERKPIVKYAVLLILIFFIMSGMKRGAILTSAVFLLFFILFSLKQSVSRTNRGKAILAFLFILVAAYAIYYIAQNVWINNDYYYERLESVQEGDSNGRDYIIQNLWYHYTLNENMFQKFFGIGAEGTLRIVNLYAHNDWMELLIDCGVFGVLIYLAYFYSFYKDCRRYRNIKPEAYIVISCCVILFVRSFFSMSFMDMHLGISIALGYGMAVCEQKYNDGLI